MKKRYRILKKDGYYYPQWKRFLFWHYFYYEREVGYISYKTEVCTLSFQRAEQFCLDQIERDGEKKIKKERKVVAYF